MSLFNGLSRLPGLTPNAVEGGRRPRVRFRDAPSAVRKTRTVVRDPESALAGVKQLEASCAYSPTIAPSSDYRK